MGQLEYGVQNYNLSVNSWSVAKIIEGRQKMWQDLFDGRLSKNDGDEAEAIKFADNVLKLSIAHTGEIDGNYQIRLGLGGLEAGFGALPANLITENKDGTLSINRDALKGTTLGNLLNIGSDIGQNLDQVA